MEFTSERGPCTIVDAASSGQRLQAFASRAFREHLGQGANQQHANCRNAARDAAASGSLLVDGIVAAGRRVLRAGELVTLALPCGPADQGAAPSGGDGQHGRPRMSLFEAEPEPEPAGESEGESSSSDGPACFSEYYRLQRICSEVEWRRALVAFGQPLPPCIRCARAASSAAPVVGALASLRGAQLRPIGWAPDAWSVRLAEGADAEAATRLLRLAQCTGEVVMQEAAAMLPAVALRPSHTDSVLDLCAAPGGKTLQLLDAMAAHSAAAAAASSAVAASSAAATAAAALPPPPGCGLLVSNDAGRQRHERTARRASCGPCTPLLATVADARHFALHRLGPDGRASPLAFDRVLCDVPCGGDGTLRKSPAKLTRWTAAAGLRAHATQLAILRRGLELLAPGGLLVYSTCALDPMQDEAVVHAALSRERSVELLTPREALGGALGAALEGVDERLAEGGQVSQGEAAAPSPLPLPHTPGLCSWRVPAPDFARSRLSYGEWGEVPPELRAEPEDGAAGPGWGGGNAGGDDDGVRHLSRSMFAPEPAGGGPRVPLERCIRVLPTSPAEECGGFFVAAMRRAPAAPPQAAAAPPPTAAAPLPAAATPPPAADAGGGSPLLEPATAEMQAAIGAFFGIAADEPSFPLRQLAGCPSSARGAAEGAAEGALLLSLVPLVALGLIVTQPVSAHGTDSPGATPAPPPPALLSAGQAAFCRMPAAVTWWPAAAPWRLCQESAELIGAVARRRVLRLADVLAAGAALTQRRTPMADLRAWTAAGSLDGLDGSAEPGAVVLLLPAPPTSAPRRAVAGLLDEDGLVLLAAADVLARYTDEQAAACASTSS